MNYLKMYCDTFDLKLEGDKIFDKHNNLIARIEDEKYVLFISQGQLLKISDLFLASLERVIVHI